ncbi:MAG: HPr family phosphocarrier protein [Oscillospiraceae bacterium]|nr:HPr family phosphocarrier protein [Oscillospiraceae bacterium]
MVTLQYTIKDPAGIHARPAGLLSKTAKAFRSEVLIEKDGSTVNASKLMMLMGMGIRCGDTITITVQGEDESEAAEAIKAFLSEHL